MARGVSVEAARESEWGGIRCMVFAFEGGRYAMLDMRRDKDVRVAR